MKHAKIINPTGLTNGEMGPLKSANYSNNDENEMSAKNVALLTRYLIRSYPAILQVSAQPRANFLISKGNVKSLANLNKMLPGGKYTVPGVTINGLKTGTSDKAGTCFVSTGQYRHHQIITVVLHANGNNADNRFVQTQRLYQMLKNDYRLQQIKLPEDVANPKIDNGAVKTLATNPQRLGIWSDRKLRSYTVSQDFNDRLTDRSQNLRAPIKKGQKIGHLRLTSAQLKTVSNEPLTYPLYSNQTVERGSFFARLFQ